MLELLRCVHCAVPAAQYSERDYWDRRYGDAAGFFDWYYGYDALREVFDAHLSRSLPILQVWLCQGLPCEADLLSLSGRYPPPGSWLMLWLHLG